MARGKHENDECICGLTYGKFRAVGQPAFDEARYIAVQRSIVAQEAGDYTVQGRRGLTLMIMHEYKMLGWKEHLYWCEQQAAHDAAKRGSGDEPVW
jgi:hypothetical protein